MTRAMTPPPLSREPPWMVAARKYLGVREIPGPSTSGVLKAFLVRLGAWWTDDETPWCATFVSAVLEEAGFTYPKAFYRAAAFADYGKELHGANDARPARLACYGTIAVLPRKGGNHVGLVVRTGTVDGVPTVWLLGGNQSNRVCVMPFPLAAIKAWRWPDKYPLVAFRPWELLPDTIRWQLDTNTVGRMGDVS